MLVNSICAVIAAWLNTFQGSSIRVGMNRSARDVKI